MRTKFSFLAFFSYIVFVMGVVEDCDLNSLKLKNVFDPLFECPKGEKGRNENAKPVFEVVACDLPQSKWNYNFQVNKIWFFLNMLSNDLLLFRLFVCSKWLDPVESSWSSLFVLVLQSDFIKKLSNHSVLLYLRGRIKIFSGSISASFWKLPAK